MRVLAFVFAVVMFVVVSHATARAGSIPVSNADFEAAVDLDAIGDPYSIGPFTINEIPGWTIFDESFRNTGVWKPVQPPDPNSVLTLPSGEQVLWVGGQGDDFAGGTVDPTKGNFIYQDLAVTVKEGVNYALTVDIGDRTDVPLGNGTGGGIGLYDAGIPITDAASLSPFVQVEFDGNFVESGFKELSASFTADPSDAGKVLRIGLFSNGPQVEFDNVVVTPIPAALPLLGTALIGLGVTGWRKRNST